MKPKSGSPTDICAECHHYRAWHIDVEFYRSGACHFPLAVESKWEVDSDDKLHVVGYLLHVDTCTEFAEGK